MFSQCNIDTRVSSTTYLNAPVWLHCQCGSKAAVKVQEGLKKETVLEGTCISCKGNLQMNLDETLFHQLSTKVIPRILLLTRELGIECYASGTFGVDYMAVGSFTFNALSINMPLVLLWPSKDDYYGIGQSEALHFIQLTKKCDIMPHIESLKHKESEYINKREKRLKAHCGKKGKKAKSWFSY